MTSSTYTGVFTYALAGDRFEVRQGEHGLLLAYPGVPPGYEAPLEPLGGHRFRVGRGQHAGAEISFAVDAGRAAALVAPGGRRLERDDAAVPGEAPPGFGLLAPPLDVGPEVAAAFDRLAAEALGDGGEVAYRLSRPKHEWLRHVAARGDVLFHGSQDPAIAELAPARESWDETEQGNVRGVYATHDPLWAMFFAVLDRGRLRGSIRNGVTTFADAAGAEVAVYHFTINQHQLADRPWSPGTLYLLPAASFERMRVEPGGGRSSEWVSRVPVEPLARLAVIPDDFPFTADVGGHDDTAVLRYEAAQAALVAAAGRVSKPAAGGLAIEVADAEVAAEYTAALAVLLPGATAVPRDGTLRLAGPDAFLDVVETALRAGPG